jgi:hypothetical protein
MDIGTIVLGVLLVLLLAGLAWFISYLDQRIHKRLHGIHTELADVKHDTKRNRQTTLSMWQALADWFKERIK